MSLLRPAVFFFKWHKTKPNQNKLSHFQRSRVGVQCQPTPATHERMKREFDQDLSEEEEDVNNLQMPQLIEHDVGFLDELVTQ